jgi:hypothetical protein
MQGLPILISKNAIASTYSWIIHHDEKWLFTLSYIGFAVVLSIWLSLFWLVLVVGVHFIFEFIRQWHLRSGIRQVLLGVLRELKLDIVLVLFAFTLSLYMDSVMGVVGLRSAARMGAVTRAGLRGASRITAWERGLRFLFLTVDDVAHLLRAFKMRSSQIAAVKTGKDAIDNQADDCELSPTSWRDWTPSWSKGDWLALVLGLVCIVLMIAVPYITEHSWTSAWSVLLDELRPFPSLIE